MIDVAKPDKLHTHAMGLPNSPGVYFFKAEDGKLLYIGKSNNIKTRVLSYFYHKNKNKKINRLLEYSMSIDFILTNNDHEALILENNLIKLHKPEFNVLLKYGGGYPYLTISDEVFPVISIGYRINNRLMARNAAEVYGPYIDGAKELLDNITRLFGIRTCSNAYFNSRTKPCIRHDIGVCSAPCAGKVSAGLYAEAIGNATLLLNKNLQYKNKLVYDLSIKMLSSGNRLDFETANKYKLLISSVESICKIQSVELHDKIDVDVVSATSRTNSISYNMMRYINGVLSERLFFDYSSSVIDNATAAFPLIYKKIGFPKKIIISANLLNEELKSFFFSMASSSCHPTRDSCQCQT